VEVKAKNLKWLALYFEGASPSNYPYSYDKMSSILTSAYRLSNGAVCVHLTGAAEAEARVPVHLVCVIDNSGSMEEQSKLQRVIESLQVLLDYMGDTDMISLVVFETSIQRPFTNTLTTADNKELVRAHLRTVRPMGGTNISSAIASLHEVMGGAPAGYKNGILFLTDGDATAGIMDTSTLLVHIQTLLAAYPALTVSTIGYGHDHKADLLRGMADAGGGSYTIVRGAEGVAGALGDLLAGLRTCVAQEVKLIVPAHVRQLSAYTKRSDTQIFLGDLLAGGEHVVVIEGLAATDALVVQASSVSTGAPLAPIPVVLTAANEEVGMRAWLRCSVVQLMEEVNRGLHGSAIAADIISRIDALAAVIRALPEHPVLALLQTQLARLTAIATAPAAPPSVTRMRSNMLSQDTTYLGTARGTMSQEPGEDPPEASPFATAVQRATSSSMSQAVSHSDTGGTPYPPAPSYSSAVRRAGHDDATYHPPRV